MSGIDLNPFGRSFVGRVKLRVVNGEALAGIEIPRGGGRVYLTPQSPPE